MRQAQSISSTQIQEMIVHPSGETLEEDTNEKDIRVSFHIFLMIKDNVGMEFRIKNAKLPMNN
mgnify:CR=1